MVMDKDFYGKDDFEGMCEISLANLQDQMKHDQWLDMRDESGEPA